MTYPLVTQAKPLLRTAATCMSCTAAVLLLALPWLNPFSVGPTPAIPTLLFAWVCAALFLLGCGISGLSQADRLLKVTVAAWLLAALLSACIGIFQYFGLNNGLDGWVNVTSVGEAFGNLRQRNHFATLTNIGMAAIIFCAARLASRTAGTRRSALQTILPALLLSAAALLAAANAASSSRTGMMQLVLLIVMVGFWGSRRGPGTGANGSLVRMVLATAGLSYGAAAASFPWLASLDPEAIGILSRLHENGAACSGRLTLWSNVLHLIAQKPWFGWGWGELGFAHFITLYPGARFCDILDNAHNLPLHLAVELGVPVALVFCLACLWGVWVAKPWRESNSARQLAWTVLAVIILHSLLEYPLWYGPFQMAAGLSIWLLCVFPSHRSDSVAAEPGDGADAVAVQTPWTTWMATVGFLAIGVCTYAAWDYWRISQIYTAPSERSADYQGDTLEKIRGSWLFQNQVRFAEMGTTTLSAHNAEHNFVLAKDLLHFSAEPQVAQRIIDSAMLLGRNEDAQFYLLRFEAAFPEAHARWTQAKSASEPQ